MQEIIKKISCNKDVDALLIEIFNDAIAYAEEKDSVVAMLAT